MSLDGSFNFDDFIVEDSQPENAPLSIKKRRFKASEYQIMAHNNVPAQATIPDQCAVMQKEPPLLISMKQQYVPIHQQQQDGGCIHDQHQPNQQAPMHNDEVLRMLKEILVTQAELAKRMSALENTSVQKSEILAQNALLRECKVAIQHVERSVCLMTGEIRDSALDEIASILPLESEECVLEVENKLDSPEFTQAMTTYIHRLKGSSTDVDSVLKNIFSDQLLKSFNWDGRGTKRALGSLTLVDPVLRGVFEQGAMFFEKDMRAAIAKSHHRTIQQNYIKKKVAYIRIFFSKFFPFF